MISLVFPERFDLACVLIIFILILSTIIISFIINIMDVDIFTVKSKIIIMWALDIMIFDC